MAILLATFIAAGFVACSDEAGDDDYLWDFAPVVVGFEVVSPDGVSLIEEGAPLHESDVKVKYGEKEFPVVWTSPTDSRAYFARLHGLFYYNGKDTESAPRLMFGELDGNLGSASLDFILPDGETHHVDIRRNITTKGPKCTVRQSVKLDGKILGEYTDGSPNILLTIVTSD